MIVTEQNSELLKAFIRILIDMEMSDEAIGMTIAMLKNVDQMDELVLFLEQNPNLTEAEILDKAQEIAGL